MSDHCGWAVLVTVAPDATVLDRRRIDLLDAQLPPLPHHHEAQSLPLERARDLIERVRASADRHAERGLDAVAGAVPSPIRGVALRECPPLPATLAERIRNYRAQTMADGVMYRQALADAAAARGWFVHWFKARTVSDEASAVLQAGGLDADALDLRQSLGAPWGKDHRIAMAAAVVAAARDDRR